MLLPSDVARLVLGYLQEEGLSDTSQAFIHESPNLKEYAEHTTGDGTIPACVFSVFGKGLTTILNEYVAAKTKARSRIGVENMARQRALTVASAGSVVCSSISETGSIISPAHTSHNMLGHSTPASFTGPHTRALLGSGTHPQIHGGSRLLNTPRYSPVQIIVSEHRINPGPMSPGRRKWETPRKRSGAPSGSSGPGRSSVTVSNVGGTEPQPEEVVDENFPVNQINNLLYKMHVTRFWGTDRYKRNSLKTSTKYLPKHYLIYHSFRSSMYDILIINSFTCVFVDKTKFTEGEPGNGDISSSPEESDAAGPSSTVGQIPSDDPGTTHRDANASDTTPVTAKPKAVQERKTRKSTAPVLKKTVLGVSGRASRIENSSAKLLVSHAEHRGVLSGAVGLNRKEKGSLFNSSVDVTPMDIDQPLNTPPPLTDSVAAEEPLEPAAKDGFQISTGFSESTTVPSSGAAAAQEAASASNGSKQLESKQAQGSKDRALSSALNNQPAFLSSGQIEPNNTPTVTAGLPHMSVSSSGRETQSVPILSLAPEFASSTFTGGTVTAALNLPSSAFTAAPFAAATGTPTCASTSATVTAASTTPASPPSSSCVSVTAASDPATANHSAPSKAAGESNNIVSLKIIISDNQEEDSATDTALNQAISSISGDKIPTIYLSSPAKSPRCPGTPKANLDETAQAVSGLQSSEAQANPLSSKAGTVVASPLTGTSQAQQSYIIQLPLDATNPTLQGATASYFLVTEPPTADAQARQVLVPAGISKGQSLPTSSQYGVTTQTRSQGYSTGSPLIIPSPIKPMMLPVSVMGQNTLTKVQVVSNQLVAIPNPVPVQQSETVQPKPPTVAVKQSTTAGAEQNLFGMVVQPLSAEKTDQQNLPKGASPCHRRILCFESSPELQTAKTTKAGIPPAANMSTSQSVTQSEKDTSQTGPRTKPTILGGNKPKRRVQTVRCSADQTGVGLVKETEKSMPPQQQHKDPIKKNSRKQDHNIHNQESDSATIGRADASQPESLKKSELGRRSKSIDRKHNHDEAKVKDSHISRSLTSDSALKPGGRKDKDESSRKEPAEKAPAKSREGRTEKGTPSQETPNVTANKENEMMGSLQEQQQSTPSSSAARDFSAPAVTQTTANPQSKVAKTSSKTSSLAKQAAEMLQDIQGINSPSTPVKRPGVSGSDLSLPRTPGTGCNQEESVDCPGTPSRQKKGKDGEGTPKHVMPPNTPDVSTCSPASEAGSINMAAHTLMILSRAAIARTGTPLKDSLRQEEVGEKSPTSSKNAKKRKQSSPTASPPSKKESKQSPGKKKDRETKKLIDCFPHDLDVDKFLSSLHYDE
ncbi:hypothetical protein PAMP_018805 [Pampus punctatissimus]